MKLEFDHLGDRGSISVSCEANDEPERFGKGKEALGYPVLTARVEFAGNGYRAFFGWIQLVGSTDNASSGAFEMDPARFFEDSPAPFCFYGYKPLLFDAPSRDGRAPIDWLAHAFLASVPRDVGETKSVRPLVGFSWGFSIDGSGQLAFRPIERLAAADWASHLGFLRDRYPSWSFEGFS